MNDDAAYADAIDAVLEGAEIGAWGRTGGACFVERTNVTIAEWAATCRVVPVGTSSEPGPYRLDRTPYLAGPMEALDDPSVQVVVFMAAAQVGKSELALNMLGHTIEKDPATVIVIQPTEGAVRSFVRERVEPMIRETAGLRELVVGDDEKNSTVLRKVFPGGMIVFGWSTSAVALASRAARDVIGDEIDKWPESTGADGAPLEQLLARTVTHGARAKALLVSTPTLESTSLIAKLYSESDRRVYEVPCVACGCFQSLEFEQLKYKRDDEIDFDDIRYECIHCGHEIREHHKPEILKRGYWRATNPGAPTAGFHASGLLSPWITWRSLCVEWVRVNAESDRRGIQAFVNLKLGLPWGEEVKQVAPASLEKNCEEYGAQVPDPVLVLTCGVDCQDNRLELIVIGWGQHREAWALDYKIVPGATDDLSPEGPWEKLGAYLSRTWSKADGTRMSLAFTLIDSLGHRTQEVFTWCRDQQRVSRAVYPCHGSGTPGHPIAGAPTLNALRAPHYLVGTYAAKEAIYSRLAMDEPGPGYMHFPTEHERGFNREFFAGLLSERLVMRKGKPTWIRTHRRNEPIDTTVYALAGLEALLITWPSLLDPNAQAAEAPRPRRRVLSRGVEPW